MKILVVGGHPADVFDRCGGTMMHHVKAGDSVTCLTLTQGLRIHDKVVSDVFRFGTEGYTREEIERICEEREAVKLQEVKDACALFGITDVRSLRYDDKILIVNAEMIDAVARIIREIKPTIVITHYPRNYGNTIDHHAETGKIVIAATQLAGSVDFEDSNTSWRIADIAFMIMSEDISGYSFEAICAGYGASPNYFVDVTDVADIKVKALDMMRSQQYEGIPARKVVETMNGMFGLHIHTPYCEAFMLNKPVVSDKINICDHWMLRMNEPERARMERDYEMIAPFVPMPE